MPILRTLAWSIPLVTLAGAAVACSAAYEEPTESTDSALRFGHAAIVPPLDEEISPEQQEAAGEAETFEQLAQDINDIQRTRAAANGGVRRGFHVKPHACVLGEFEVLADRPAEAKFGVLASNRRYPAWVRLSNAQSVHQSDKTADIRGLAVKLLDVPGTKLMEGQEDATTQDLLSINGTTLVVKDAPTFMEFQKAIVAGGLTAAGFFLKHPEIAIGAARILHPVNSMFSERFFSGVPSKLGPRAVKFSFSPCVTADHGHGAIMQSDSYLRDDAVRTLEATGACFDFSVQFQRDPVAQPVEDSSVEWKESEAPFVRVARLTLPRQDMHTEESFRKEEFCEKLVWNPWHSLPEHRPIGNANRARKSVMLSAQRFRGTPQPPAEPTGDETFESSAP